MSKARPDRTRMRLKSEYHLICPTAVCPVCKRKVRVRLKVSQIQTDVVP